MEKSDNDPQARPRVELRRYPNRRFYDRTRSQHLNLEEIHRLVRDGYQVSISDSKPGEDITAKVLAHILIEHDPPKLAAFPAELLHQIIRSNESLLRDFVEKYFNQALAAFLKSQQEFDHYLGQAMGLYTLPLMGRDWMQMMMRPLLAGPQPNATPATEADAAASRTQDDDLRRTVEELKQQIGALRRELKQQ
jgi:polyhydroxyalkanoate synthesis repressor PhaR